MNVIQSKVEQSQPKVQSGMSTYISVEHPVNIEAGIVF